MSLVRGWDIIINSNNVVDISLHQDASIPTRLAIFIKTKDNPTIKEEHSQVTFFLA